MTKSFVAALALFASLASSALAADFDASAAHAKFINAFNHRQWAELQPLLAQDIVFHRSNADTVYTGPVQVIGRFQKTIGGEWNVKFVKLDSTNQMTGKDGKVVERSDFAVTAGAKDDSCYAGSYMMTWAPQSGNKWQLERLAWQDVETDLSNCK
jgi:ABC-type glycerol-3-phosphate transport system substrate-binding protein